MIRSRDQQSHDDALINQASIKDAGTFERLRKRRRRQAHFWSATILLLVLVATSFSIFCLRLVLSGRSPSRTTLHGIALGAVCFAAISAMLLLRVARDQRRLTNLEKDSMVDATSGVLNRLAILRRVKDEVDRAERESLTLALFLVALDDFEGLNERLGVPVGKEIIGRVGHLLRAAVRPYDSVGRYAHDEFLVALPACPESRARDIASRLMATIDAPFDTRKGRLHVGATIGVIVARPPFPTTRTILDNLEASIPARPKGFSS